MNGLDSPTITVTKQMWTETGHRLINYSGKCAHIHGHSYLWEVTAQRFDGGLNHQGFVTDFKDLKAMMTEVIDEGFDHAFVLHQDDPLLKLIRTSAKSKRKSQEAEILRVLAASDGTPPRLRIVPFNPSAENLAKYVLKELQRKADRFWMGSEWKGAAGKDCRLIIERVRVWETRSSYADCDREIALTE